MDPAPSYAGPLVFGGAPIGGLYAPVSDEAAAGTLAAAWDAGIRAFDTAPHYGVGVSERRLGAFLAGRPRDEFTVCTKVGRRLVPAAGDVQGEEGFYDIPPLTRVRDYSRDGVRRSLEESLERLGLDRVDIVLIHDPDDFMEQAADEAYPALAELRAQGTVRAVGAGMNSARRAGLAGRALRPGLRAGGRPVHAARPVGRRDAVPAVPAARRGGAGRRRVQQRHPGRARTTARPTTTPRRPPALLARARRMRDACARYGVPLAAAALRFTLRHPAVTAAVVGARTPEEITADVSYLSMQIPGELWGRSEPSASVLTGAGPRRRLPRHGVGDGRRRGHPHAAEK